MCVNIYVYQCNTRSIIEKTIEIYLKPLTTFGLMAVHHCFVVQCYQLFFDNDTRYQGQPKLKTI